jgi:exonuclease-1
MGIQGLLPLLKSIERPVHLKDYAGYTLAVDGYVWLHKGAFSCAQELCLGQPTQKYAPRSSRRPSIEREA